MMHCKRIEHVKLRKYLTTRKGRENYRSAYQKDERRHWRETVNIDQGDGRGQVALARAHEEESRRGEDGAVEGAEAAARHEKGHHPRRGSQHSATERLKFGF